MGEYARMVVAAEKTSAELGNKNTKKKDRMAELKGCIALVTGGA
jgi:hypothetical protein